MFCKYNKNSVCKLKQSIKSVELYGVDVAAGVPVDITSGLFVDVAVGVEVDSGVIFDCNSLINASSKPEGKRLLDPPPCARRA